MSDRPQTDETLNVPPPQTVAVDPHVAQHGGDVDLGALAKFLIAMVVGIAVTAGAVYYYLEQRRAAIEATEPVAIWPADERTPPPQPRLQTLPAADMRQFRAAQEADLRRTAWVDRSRGLVQLPIERAMQIVARDGLPRWPSIAAATPATTTTSTPTATPSSTSAPMPPITPTATATPAPSPTSRPTGPVFPGEAPRP